MHRALAALVIGWGLYAPAHAQELFPIQQIPGGGDVACSGGDSGFIPAGYKCVVALSDEMNGTGTINPGSVVNGKFKASGGGSIDMFQGNGAISMVMQQPGSFNGSTSGGLTTLSSVPDAPSYLEYRRRFVPLGSNNISPGQAYGSIAQFWTSSFSDQFNGPSTQEETDIDMGEECGGGGANPPYSPVVLCTAWTDWSIPGNPFYETPQFGTIPIYNNSDWHVIGMQRLPTPSPNGSIVISVDGVEQVVIQTGIPYNAFPSVGNTGQPDVWVANLFCAIDACPYGGMEVDIDYLRIYTPCGNAAC